jgi:putative ABC transport system ATP-binding protein
VRRLRAEEELEKVGLGHRVHHRPQQLSGGQQQRVAIARALVADPPLLLADEPTGNLDHTTGLEILEILRELSKQGKTVVIVTHSAEVAQVCPQVIEIQDGHIVTNTVEMEHMR